MNSNEIITQNINDLKVGLDLARIINYDILKEYSENRINTIESNKNMYQYVSIDTLIDSYVIDLALFINISNVILDVDSKDYFKSKLIYVMKLFPKLKERADLVNLV